MTSRNQRNKSKGWKDAWQIVLSQLRNDRIKKVKDYLDRIDEILQQAKQGVKPDKNEIEALKLALKTLGALGEEKPERLDKLRKKPFKDKKPIQSGISKQAEKEADSYLNRWKNQNTTSSNNSA